jgi:hypothetical protein
MRGVVRNYRKLQEAKSRHIDKDKQRNKRISLQKNSGFRWEERSNPRKRVEIPRKIASEGKKTSTSQAELGSNRERR